MAKACPTKSPLRLFLRSSKPSRPNYPAGSAPPKSEANLPHTWAGMLKKFSGREKGLERRSGRERKFMPRRSLPELSGADRERAQLRILGMRSGARSGPSEMVALQNTDPDVDAERLDALAEYYRGQQQEAQMVAAIEGVISRAPSSHWAESALFLGGQLLLGAAGFESARAGYYKRLEEDFPASTNAPAAQWRVCVGRRPETAARCRRAAAGSPAALSRIIVLPRRAVLARPASPKRPESRPRARLLRETGGALSAETI